MSLSVSNNSVAQQQLLQQQQLASTTVGFSFKLESAAIGQL